MWRWFRLAALGAAMLLLTGCITSQTATTVEKDGSGSNSMVIGFSKQLMLLAQMGGEGEDIFGQIEESLVEEFERFPEQWNIQSEPWEDAQYQGFKITMHFSDLEMLEEQLNELLTNDDITGMGGSPTQGMFSNIEIQQDGPLVTIRAQANSGGALREALEESEELAGAGVSVEQMSMIFEQMKVSWSVTLPAICSYADEGIGTRAGHTVTWTFPFSEDESYDLEVLGILGAASYELITRVNADKGGSNELLIGAELEVSLTDKLLADAQAQIAGLPAEWQPRVESWEATGLKGIKLITEFSDLGMLKAQLDRLAGPGSQSDQRCLSQQIYQSFDVREDGSQIVVGGQIQTGGGSATRPPRWSVELPEITAVGGDLQATQAGNLVTWEFDPAQARAVKVEVTGSTGGLNLLLIGLVALLALGLVAIVTGLLLRRRAQPVLVASEPPAPGAPPPPGWETQPLGGSAYGEPRVYDQPEDREF